MKTKVCSTLVLSMIGGMLAGCSAGSSDSLDATSAKLQERIKSVPSCPAWQSGGSYYAGEIVYYGGAYYTSLINQTDYAGTGWNPTVATLFSPGASCGTPPPYPISGPGPAPIPTPAPTPLPTPAPGSCPPEWSSTVAYTAGEEVLGSDGMVFVANWWNENTDPAANNYGPADSGEPWSWIGTFCGGATSGPIPTPVPPPTPAPTPTPTPS